MSLKSMTGFSRVEGASEGTCWYWELRSVNGRGLDIRTRLGQGMDAMDSQIRTKITKVLSRGNVNVTLSVQRTDGAMEIRLNEDALRQVFKAMERVQEMTKCAPLGVEGLLALKGVLETKEVVEDQEVVSARAAQMMETFDQALGDLVASRELEGRALLKVISDQIIEIERLVGVVSNSKSRTPEAIRARLKAQVDRLVEGNGSFDEDRLYQEVALLATRCDVEEELKRLEQHIQAARSLLSDGGPVGRKLDFLAQEFNREANTLCSKSNDGEVSQAGVALKVVIDQMREQVQNIE